MLAGKPNEGNRSRRDATPAIWRRQREAVLRHLSAQLSMRDKLFRLWVDLAYNQDDYCQVPLGVMCYLDLDEIGARLGRSRAAVAKGLRELEIDRVLTVERNFDGQVRIVLVGKD